MSIPSYSLSDSALVVHGLQSYLERAGAAALRSHRHEFWQVIRFEGSGTHHVDLQAHRYRAGSVLVLAEGAIHRFSDTMNRGTMLHFPASFFGRSPQDARRLLRLRTLASAAPIVTPSGADGGRCAELVVWLIEEQARQPHDAQVQHATLHSLMLLFMRNSPDASPEQSDYLRFLELVEEQYKERPSIADVARALQLSTKRLYATTAAARGLSPGKVIDHRLILEAKRRLVHSSEPVSSIAFSLGFTDPAYFARFFRKHTGQSPRSFRLP